MALPAWRRYRQAGVFFYSTARRGLFGTRCAAFRLSLRLAALPVKNHVAAFPCGCPAPASEFIHQITMRFGGGAGRFENIAPVVFQCFQPGSNVAFMLYLSLNP